jgi:hypothetical protein
VSPNLRRPHRRPPPSAQALGMPPRTVRRGETAGRGEGRPRIGRVVLRYGLRVPPRHVGGPEAGDAGPRVDRPLADDLVPPRRGGERGYAGDRVAALVADVHRRLPGEGRVPRAVALGGHPRLRGHLAVEVERLGGGRLGRGRFGRRSGGRGGTRGRLSQTANQGP